MDDLDPFPVHLHFFSESAVVHIPVVLQRNRIKVHTEVLQGSVPGISVYPDHSQQCIIRHAGQRKHHVPRSEQSEQRHGDRMCPGNQLRPHKSALPPENLRRQLVDGIPSSVAVPVPGRRCKQRFTDLRLPEAVQHMLRIHSGDSVDILKYILHIPFRLLSKRTDLFRNLHFFVVLFYSDLVVQTYWVERCGFFEKKPGKKLYCIRPSAIFAP